MRICVHVCMCACVCICVRMGGGVVRLCACVCAWVHLCVILWTVASEYFWDLYVCEVNDININIIK